ncbi:zinc-ribbon domain containing protein [Phytomonospora sp. NPDC050363]|uniref:zinc-ribbon domain containing protein n=1 Tax=Phytomonospora sp. NPDC050363 TaxID=3155642 RepID=UPI0033C0998C
MGEERFERGWRGRLSGRHVLLGAGRVDAVDWFFRADGESWGCQVAGRDAVRGVGGTGAASSFAEAWPLIDEALRVFLAGEMPVLGPPNKAPLTRHPYPGEPGPTLPKGAVRADPSRQNSGMWPQHQYYVDSHHTCVQCGIPFVLSAKEQRHWYEDLGLSFDIRPVRCTRCRREQRAVKRLHAAVGTTRAAVRERGADAVAHLELAAAVVRLHADQAEGDLAEAVAEARKAIALNPSLHVAHYWKGRAHELAGRPTRAAEDYRAFVSAVSGRPGWGRKLIEDAYRRLKALGE